MLYDISLLFEFGNLTQGADYAMTINAETQ